MSTINAAGKSSSISHCRKLFGGHSLPTPAANRTFVSKDPPSDFAFRFPKYFSGNEKESPTSITRICRKKKKKKLKSFENLLYLDCNQRHILSQPLVCTFFLSKWVIPFIKECHLFIQCFKANDSNCSSVLNKLCPLSGGSVVKNLPVMQEA